MAYKASYGFIQGLLSGPLGVGPNGVSSVYRYENSKKNFATLTQAAHLAHYNRLHGVKLELKDPQMMGTVEHQDKEKAKGVVSWVPVAFKTTAVKKIVAAEVFQIKSCPDKWSFHFNPEINIKEIPHYATINLEGSTRPEIRLQITVQGRRPPCNIWDDDTHWSTHCPLKRTGGGEAEREGSRALPNTGEPPGCTCQCDGNRNRGDNHNRQGGPSAGGPGTSQQWRGGRGTLVDVVLADLQKTQTRHGLVPVRASFVR
jgi:hypothetical protein